MEIFWLQGYAGTSLPDLLTAMEIGRSSFYETFGSKRAAFEAALELYDTRITQWVLETVAEPGPIRTVLANLFSSMVTRGLNGQSRGCLIGNTAVELGPHDDEIRGRVATSMARVENALTDRLSTARQGGELASAANPRALARTLLAVIHGMRVVGKARPDHALLEDITTTALKLLDEPAAT